MCHMALKKKNQNDVKKDVELLFIYIYLFGLYKLDLFIRWVKISYWHKSNNMLSDVELFDPLCN